MIPSIDTYTFTYILHTTYYILNRATSETKTGVDDWLTRVKEIFPRRSATEQVIGAGDIRSALNNGSLEYVDDRENDENNSNNNARRLPPGRFEKIMRFLHTEPTKGQKLWKYYFEPTWVMIMDILTIILDKQVWYNLFGDVKLLFTSKNQNLIILSKEHIVLIILACLFGTFCWTLFLFCLWIWYNQSFYDSLTESNQLLKQQTELLLQIIANRQQETPLSMSVDNDGATVLIDDLQVSMNNNSVG